MNISIKLAAKQPFLQEWVDFLDYFNKGNPSKKSPLAVCPTIILNNFLNTDTKEIGLRVLVSFTPSEECL